MPVKKKAAPAAKKKAAKRKSAAAKPQAPAEPEGLLLARAVADAADFRKAEDIRILDVRGLSMITDFLVIASGSSAPHLRAIRDEIVERLRENLNERPHSTEGIAESQWLLIDYGNVVAHLFLPDKRSLFALEDLWGDAPRVDWQPT